MDEFEVVLDHNGTLYRTTVISSDMLMLMVMNKQNVPEVRFIANVQVGDMVMAIDRSKWFTVVQIIKLETDEERLEKLLKPSSEEFWGVC